MLLKIIQTVKIGTYSYGTGSHVNVSDAEFARELVDGGYAEDVNKELTEVATTAKKKGKQNDD